jgi:hypothetical protein
MFSKCGKLALKKDLKKFIIQYNNNDIY